MYFKSILAWPLGSSWHCPRTSKIACLQTSPDRHAKVPHGPSLGVAHLCSALGDQGFAEDAVTGPASDLWAALCRGCIGHPTWRRHPCPENCALTEGTITQVFIKQFTCKVPYLCIEYHLKVSINISCKGAYLIFISL